MRMALGTITMGQLVGETVWLRRLATSLVKDQADDVVHDTLIIAQQHAPADRPLRPWLARVLVNRVRMIARGSSRRRKREEALGELATAPVGPDEIVDRIKLQRLLAGCVLDLAQPLRDVLLLHYYEGLTSYEIGNRLGIADGTVRWRLKQAIDELRQRLDDRAPNRAWLAPMAGLANGSGTAGAGAFACVFAALAAPAGSAAVPGLRKPTPVASAAGVSHEAPASAPKPDVPHDPVPATTGGSAQVVEIDQMRIVGRIVDRDGKPVAGADVQVSCQYGGGA